MTQTQGLSSPLKKLENIVRRALFTIEPNFGKFDRPIFAKVLKVNFKGGKVDDGAKAYSVDLQPLLKDLTVDSDFDKIQDVPLNTGTFGNGGVIYCTPKVGAVVRMGFMYSDPSYPFIINVTNEGMKIPEGSAEEFRIETGNGIILQLKGEKINFKSKEFDTDLETIVAKFLIHTHLGNMGAPTSSVSGSIPPITSADFKTGTL